MARVAFDIDEKTKREIKVRLAKEGRTLSEVMRILCWRYRDFGLEELEMISSDHPHHEDGNETPKDS